MFYVCLGDLEEADAVADRVSRLDQNNLPEMYQAGSCNDVTGGSSSVQPAHLLTLLTSLLGFVITLGSISI